MYFIELLPSFLLVYSFYEHGYSLTFLLISSSYILTKILISISNYFNFEFGRSFALNLFILHLNLLSTYSSELPMIIKSIFSFRIKRKNKCNICYEKKVILEHKNTKFKSSCHTCNMRICISCFYKLMSINTECPQCKKFLI